MAKLGDLLIDAGLARERLEECRRIAGTRTTPRPIRPSMNRSRVVWISITDSRLRLMALALAWEWSSWPRSLETSLRLARWR